MALSPRRLAVLHRNDAAARRFVRVHRTLESLAVAALSRTGHANRKAVATLLERLWARARTDARAATPDVQTFLDWAAVTLVRIVRELHPTADTLTPQLQRLFAPATLGRQAEVTAAVDRVAVLIADLTIPQQMVATLHFLEARKVEQIVTALPMKECDVLHHLHSANEILRARLTEERGA